MSRFKKPCFPKFARSAKKKVLEMGGEGAGTERPKTGDVVAYCDQEHIGLKGIWTREARSAT